MRDYRSYVSDSRYVYDLLRSYQGSFYYKRMLPWNHHHQGFILFDPDVKIKLLIVLQLFFIISFRTLYKRPWFRKSIGILKRDYANFFPFLSYMVVVLPFFSRTCISDDFYFAAGHLSCCYILLSLFLKEKREFSVVIHRKSRWLLCWATTLKKNKVQKEVESFFFQHCYARYCV